MQLRPLTTDKDFSAYLDRITAEIKSHCAPELDACEWQMITRHEPQTVWRTQPDQWRTGEPMAYIRTGTECPIVELRLVDHSRDELPTLPVWSAKTFNTDAARSLLLKLTTAAHF